jgi:hypothetical protein
MGQLNRSFGGQHLRHWASLNCQPAVWTKFDRMECKILEHTAKPMSIPAEPLSIPATVVLKIPARPLDVSPKEKWSQPLAMLT